MYRLQEGQLAEINIACTNPSVRPIPLCKLATEASLNEVVPKRREYFF